MAATSPSGGPFSWSSGAVPDGTPASPRTPMYAGSIAKQFVGALVGLAVLGRQLDLDTSARRMVPTLPAWAEDVHVCHLVHHTAGLPTTAELLAVLDLCDEAALDNSLVLGGLGRVSQLREVPGGVFAYSNIGYVLLAEVLRAAAAADPADLATTALFTPLGLRSSSFRQNPPYTLRHPPPRTIGDGGLWTTAIDLLRWLDALNQGLLGEELTTLLQTPGRLENGTLLDYAWGMTARPGSFGTTYTHGGTWRGWTAKTVRNPAARTALALLTSHDDPQLVSDVAVAMHDELVLG